MPDEEKQKRRDLRDILNLAATIIGPLLICGVFAWGTWSLKIYMANELAAQAKFTADNFVGKDGFQKSHEETVRQINSLSSDVGDLKTGVAVINSKLDNVVHTTR
jgi:hypothetical protein